MATANVLLVDDEVDFAQVIAERMRSRGFEVDTAASGSEGLEKIREHNYDAILLDLAMPGMDGMETMKRMLEFDRNLQIIILTGQGSVQKGVEAVKKGAVDFLEKPADIETLAGKVTTAQQKRVALFQEDLEQKMDNIMKKKGW
jgi:DNA-binding NtrC family response regulator